MSGVTCPSCGEFQEVFGPRQGETAANRFGVPFLGSIPLDPNLAALCDAGKVEQYESATFKKIAQEVLESIER